MNGNNMLMGWGPRGSWKPAGPSLGVIAGAVLLLTTACTSTSTPASESERQATRFPGVYAQTIDWGTCDASFGMSENMEEILDSYDVAFDAYECAWVEAPLDWNDPGNRETISLAAVRIPATGSSEPLGALFGNPGGPGSSGMDYTFTLPTSPNFEEVREHYDLVGFDPRGIGLSAPLDCGEDSDIQELVIAECADNSPIALSMGTSQVARDMELMRTLLGQPELDYLGYSYGTVLGATYATLFPEHVGRMILDSAIAADWASPKAEFMQSVAIADATAELFTDCESVYQAESCPMQSEDDFFGLLIALDEQPAIASDGTPVTGAMLEGFITSRLYGAIANRTATLNTVAGLIEENQADIDAIAIAMSSGGAEVDLSGKIVSCHSFPDDPKLVDFLEYVEQTGIPGALGGPEISDETLEPWVDLACDALPNSGDDITEKFSGSPDSPILVIGITGDHATPYESSVKLAEQLGNARLLTLDGVGHGASYSDLSPCISEYATEYLIHGKLPPKNTICEM